MATEQVAGGAEPGLTPSSPSWQAVGSLPPYFLFLGCIHSPSIS